MKIGVIVPLFVKLKDTLKLLNFLHYDMGIPGNDILVVENNVESSDSMHLDLDFEVQIIRFSEALGSAGVFGEGLVYFKKKGYDWAWFMDDDALPAVNALEKLRLRICDLADDRQIINVGAVCSVMVDPLTHSECWNLRNLNKFNARNTYEEILISPYTGMLVNLKIVDESLLPSRKIFFWVDDTEFCLRLRKSGYIIFRDLGSIVYHPSPSKKKYIFNRYRLIPPSNRVYFYIRNTLSVYYMYDKPVTYYLKRIPSMLLQNIISVFQDGDPKQRLYESARAYIDTLKLIISIRRSGW